VTNQIGTAPAAPEVTKIGSIVSPVVFAVVLARR
jgi:hypothetical protein